MNYTADYDPYIDGSGSEPRPVNIDGHGNNYESSRHLENGAYFRLKNLQLGYTVPWNRLQNLRIFIAGQNLFTITNYAGIDPEFRPNDTENGDGFTTNLAPGIERRGTYFTTTSFTFGVLASLQ
jgi:iron complex outermembrane receptor protein